MPRHNNRITAIAVKIRGKRTRKLVSRHYITRTPQQAARIGKKLGKVLFTHKIGQSEIIGRMDNILEKEGRWKVNLEPIKVQQNIDAIPEEKTLSEIVFTKSKKEGLNAESRRFEHTGTINPSSENRGTSPV